MNPTTEFQYLEQLIRFRLNTYFPADQDETLPSMPNLNHWQLPVVKFVRENKLTVHEATLLLIGLAPYVQPDLFDNIIQTKITGSGDFPKLGGVRGKNFRGFLPTGETAVFLLAGADFEKRWEVESYFDADHFFAKNQILTLEEPPDGEPKMSGKILVSQDYVDLFTRGRMDKPRFSLKFPAELITTEMEWDDLVLNEETNAQIQELRTWIDHGDTLMYDWGMHKKLKPGYRVLFHGPPGTGKTLTATLLGKYTDKDVYKIDLSMVVSKFIGETEKNLANLLARAEKMENILFFDEADALFGKRTGVRDAHDKYANQEVSYLLQRIESYKGLVILASNMKSNIDEAFVRRFQSIISFPLPKASERLLIWKNAFPSQVRIGKDLDLGQVASKYELSGAEIMNIVQYACLCALEDKKKTIYPHYVANGIQREFQKGGRIMR